MTGDKSLDLPPPDTWQSLARRVLVRIRHHGVLWLPRRAILEVRSPVTTLGRLLNGALRRCSSFSRGLTLRASKTCDDTLLAFYDLLVEPNTFDVIWFLMAAERHRRLHRLSALHIVFVGSEPGKERDEPAEYWQVVSRSSWRDRITNILVPLAWAIPSVTDVEILHDRGQAQARRGNWRADHVFPRHYSVSLHRSHILDWSREILRSPVPESVSGAFRASEAAKAFVDRWLEARNGVGRAIAITIRYYAYNPARNSNLEAWARFAEYLEERGYLPIFVPDTESLADGLPKILETFPHFIEGAINLNLRLALYERAFLNLGINNGPAFLFLVDETAAGLMFKIITRGVENNEEPYLIKQGFAIGGQIPFCTSFQKRVWEDDDFDVIQREFELMETALKAKTRMDENNV